MAGNSIRHVIASMCEKVAFKNALDARLRAMSADAAIERRMRGAHPYEAQELATWRAMTASMSNKSAAARKVIRAFGMKASWFDVLRKLL